MRLKRGGAHQFKAAAMLTATSERTLNMKWDGSNGAHHGAVVIPQDPRGGKDPSALAGARTDVGAGIYLSSWTVTGTARVTVSNTGE